MKQQIQLTKDWETVKIGEISDSYAGGTPSRSKKGFYGGNILWVKSGEVSNRNIIDTEEKITESGLENSSARKVPANTILVAMYGATAGKVGILRKEATTNQAVLAILNNKEMFNPEFLYYLLSSKTNKLVNTTQGTGQPNLSKTLIDSLEIIIPSNLQEQTAIAKILSTIDDALEALERERLATERLRRGFMVNLLTRGVGNNEFKFNEELKCKIPKHWQVLRYIDVADFINGYPFKPSEWKRKGLPIIRIQNLNGNENYNYFDGQIDEDYIINKEDLLFSWSATIDLFVWQKEKAVLNQHIFKVVPKPNVDKLYLYYAIKNFLSTISGKVHGSTMKHFKKDQLYKNYLPLPPLSEQKRIAEILSTIDNKLELQKARKNKLERIKKGLMDELLTGKKRVNVEKVLEVEK